jgi:ribosomal protein S18 acetylase RimI-like enzyme
MLIRECSEMDIDALDRFLPTRPPRQVHAEHFALQEAGRWTYMVAWDDDAVPVGVGVIRWEGWSDQAALAAFPDCPELTNLQVHEARRGSGVGTALIQAAEERVRARGFSRIGVGVADDNPKAAKLYARLGYADTGLRSESRYLYPDDSGCPARSSNTTPSSSKPWGGSRRR